MILLWGIPGESPFDAVRAELAAANQDLVVLDQRAVGDWSIELTTGKTSTGRLIGPRGAIDLGAITAVYARPYDPMAIPAVVAAGVGSRIADHALGFHEAVRLWTELCSARVVNKLSAMSSNGSKPYQLRLVRDAGFAVPPTLVTTDPAAAKAFLGKQKDAIYKSVSSIRSIVARVGADVTDERLAMVAGCPTQFQGYVAGTDVRVHVVGDRTFACEVSTTATDYRYPAGAEVGRKLVDLPKDVADRCKALAAKLDLPVAGIDLRRPDKKGDWTCFEVNPSPAFTYYDIDGAIAKAVAQLLGGTP
ncbi:MAG TPA: hypothetical protein VGM88_15145 [Kofleriaceae bacterium]|jgi:hypothetical protein